MLLNPPGGMHSIGMGLLNSFVEPSGPAWNIDAASTWNLPISAAEWTAFNAAKGLSTANPDYLWLCNEPSGNLALAIGSSFTLVATASPQYNQTTAYFTRPGVGFTDNSSMGFQAASGVGYNPATESFFWLVVATIRTEPTALRIFYGQNPGGGTNQCRMLFNPSAGNNRMQIQWQGGGSTVASDHGVGAHIFGIKGDRTNVISAGYSELVKYAAANAALTDGQKGIGLAITPDVVIHYMACWKGANAEAFSDANTKALYQAIGPTIPW